MGYLEGYLRRRSNTEESEHTGYVVQVEVEVSALGDLEELVDERVAITGGLELIDYPKRGRELVFRATSAAAIDEDVEE